MLVSLEDYVEEKFKKKNVQENIILPRVNNFFSKKAHYCLGFQGKIKNFSNSFWKDILWFFGKARQNLHITQKALLFLFKIKRD